MEKHVAIITGAGSGIGRSAADALLEQGWTVYNLSRTERSGERSKFIACDVSKEDQARSAVEKIVTQEGQIDLLVNCAGFGISGAVEFTDPSDASALMNVNLMGADRMVQLVVPHMRKQGKGRIINISSVAAVLPIPFQAWYSASKAAINAYTLALRNEIAPFGISVCAVMPGDIRTGFTGARVKKHAGNEVYSGRIERAVGKMERDEENGMPPEKAGKLIAKLARKKRVRPFAVPGLQYKLFCLLARVLPASASNAIVGKIYS